MKKIINWLFGLNKSRFIQAYIKDLEDRKDYYRSVLEELQTKIKDNKGNDFVLGRLKAAENYIQNVMESLDDAINMALDTYDMLYNEIL